jgi:hypothetical protein
MSTILFAATLTLGFGLPESLAAEIEADTTTVAAELRATEEAFARTMADRDHHAFVSFLAEEAVFFGPQGEIRGKAAVAAAWKPFYEIPRLRSRGSRNPPRYSTLATSASPRVRFWRRTELGSGPSTPCGGGRRTAAGRWSSTAAARNASALTVVDKPRMGAASVSRFRVFEGWAFHAA